MGRLAIIASLLLFIGGCYSHGDTAPLVIAHRGASGYLPEETLEAYQLAIDMGADALELDLVSTKDGVLIARHDTNLEVSTDVASRPEFASRKRTDWWVDGVRQTGWFAHDFTWEEIQTLGAISTDQNRPQQFNGKFKIIRLEQLLTLAKAQSAILKKPIAIYPETKHPSYHRALGLPLEETLVTIIKQAELNHRQAPIFIQSFEPSSLQIMRSLGLKTRLVQLIGADDFDLKAGALTYKPPYDKPHDWSVKADPRSYFDMVTPKGLAAIKTYADGIAPWKFYVVPVKGSVNNKGALIDTNGDGKIDIRDARIQATTRLIADAHAAGLFVHASTFKNEAEHLAADYRGDPLSEYRHFYGLGIDGVFSDFPDTAMIARADHIRQRTRLLKP
jgi:glycerophosphoryl diester phosphodiesterase